MKGKKRRRKNEKKEGTKGERESHKPRDGDEQVKES